ncbi:hypothetical protein OG906_33715 [Streptomyces sp. NBC_01426]|uniref:hypothetical protein n=1 Tax=Streptomyces sp. NBC_01426 TaxID=2975866 RepID=UPI002E343C64|nr:hypothetical protein [Streptomyces sp. NBC_01426]
MIRTRRRYIAGVTVAAALTAGLAASPAHALLPNRSCGTITAADSTAAANLNKVLTGKMAHAMTAYRFSCARAIVEATRARGLSERASVIAVTTAIVESVLENNPNRLDHTSVGLFQQQDWWGSFEERLDPAYATNAFLNAMVKAYPNNSWQSQPIGVVAQKVQVSAYPDRYQLEAGDAQRIVDALKTGDIPVAGNWDGGQAANVGVWRDGKFHLRYDDGTVAYVDWGQAGDLPVSANWDGAGPDNVGVFRPSTGKFHLRMDDGSLTILDWGQAGDLPVAGNWDGGTAANIGVWRAGTFHLRNDDGSINKIDWGQAGDLPVAGNWDGTGPDNVGVFRPSTGKFHLRMDDGSLTILDWGQAGDLPVAANWDGGNGGPAANIGIWRPSQGRFHLRNDDGTLTNLDWGQPR